MVIQAILDYKHSRFQPHHVLDDGWNSYSKANTFQAHSSPQIIEFKVDLHPSYPFLADLLMNKQSPKMVLNFFLLSKVQK